MRWRLMLVKKKRLRRPNLLKKKSRFCQICFKKSQKSKAKTHNTVNCYDKLGNENKLPPHKPFTLSSSLLSGSENETGAKIEQHPDNKLSWKAHLLVLLNEEGSNNDRAVSLAETVNINLKAFKKLLILSLPKWGQLHKSIKCSWDL